MARKSAARSEVDPVVAAEPATAPKAGAARSRASRKPAADDKRTTTKAEEQRTTTKAARKKEPAATTPDYYTGSNAPVEGYRSLERALGAKIRDARRQRDLSVLDLAGAAKISAGMLSKIENGQISPSLSTLQAIANALAFPLSMLFAASEERRDCSFVRAQQGVVVRSPHEVEHAHDT